MEDPRHHVHSTYIWLGGFRGSVALFAALLFGVVPQAIPLVFSEDGLGFGIVGAAAGIAVALIVGAALLLSVVANIVYRAFSYKHLWYELGDEEFSLFSGILNKQRVHVPYARIQSVDERASLLQRACGVCSVSIDTAGGSANKAVLVPYLRKADAESLRAELFSRKRAALAENASAEQRKQKLAGTAGVQPSPEAHLTNVLDAPAELWDDVRGVFAGGAVDTGAVSFEYGLSNKELLLAGFSNNTALLLIVVGIVGALSQIVDVAASVLGDSGDALLAAAGAGLALFGGNLVALAAVALVGLTAALWVLSALGSCLGFGGFRARRRGDRIEVERGLLSHRFQSIAVGRVQSVVVKQSFVRKLFGYCELSLARIDAADGASEDSDSLNPGALVIHPFVKVDRAPELLGGIIPEFSDVPQSEISVARVALRRAVIRRGFVQGVALWCAVAVAALAFGIHAGYSLFGDGFITPVELAVADKVALVALAACAVGFICAIVGAVLWARESSFSYNASFMRVVNGGLSREVVVLPRNKIQFGYLRSNPFQRRARTSTVVARTAAGSGGTSLQLIDACEEDAASWLVWLRPRGNVLE